MAFTFRIATPSDAQQLLTIYAPFVENTFVSMEYETPSLEAFTQRIEGILTVYPYIVCCQDERIVGYAYASRLLPRAGYQWNTELSVYVDPAFHRHGVARALYTALIELLGMQNIQNIYAILSLPNEKSERFHRSMGFEPLNRLPKTSFKHGAWHDVLWMYRMIGDHPDAPAPLIPWTTIDTAAVQDTLAQAAASINK